MNKLYLLLCLLFATTGLAAQTLFTYGPYEISRETFLRAFNKNRTASANKQKELKQYLVLYERFRLKVSAAEDAHLDTLAALKAEVENFRNQLAASYMEDDSAISQLAEEAFYRQQKDIHLLHFFVPVDEAHPKDSLVAYQAIFRLYHDLRNKKTVPVTALSEKQKQAYGPVKGGDMGYVTAFSLPYVYENIAYALTPGAASAPYRSKTGWHVFVNAGERKGAGRWKVAQVFFALPPHAAPAMIDSVRSIADSVYRLLLAGADFATLARQYSQDKHTYMRGGEMPEFGAGTFDTSFESSVFALKADGAFTIPFLTTYGYHIVKRLHHTDAPAGTITTTDLERLKQQVRQDERIAVARAKFIQDVEARVPYTPNPAISEAVLLAYGDSIVTHRTMDSFPIREQVIFSIGQTGITGRQWLEYAYGHALHASEKISIKALLESFIREEKTRYYRDHLEAYSPAFYEQVQEFRDGNLLFEIMNREVWGKAEKDTAGVKNYYAQHRNRYTWLPSAALVLLTCSDTSSLREAAMALKKEEDWHTLAAGSKGKIQVDSGRYEMADLPVPSKILFKDGAILGPYSDSSHAGLFIKVIKTYPAGQLRSFEEARGLVINGYQQQLEDEWLARLGKQYPIVLNQPVWKALLQ